MGRDKKINKKAYLYKNNRIFIGSHQKKTVPVRVCPLQIIVYSYDIYKDNACNSNGMCRERKL